MPTMTPVEATVPTVAVRGLSISKLDFAESRALLRAWMTGSVPRRVATVNLSFLRLADEDPRVAATLAGSDLLTADGVPVLWLAKRNGTSIPGRTCGSDLVPALAEDAAEIGAPVFFLGGAPGDGEAAAALLKARHPKLQVAGVLAPEVVLRDEEACRTLAARIRESGAKLLFVGLGCPNQEYFLERYLGSTGCSLGLGIGGTFAFITGRVQRAPEFWQRLQLEWLWRIKEEPRRLLGRYLKDASFLFRAWRQSRSRR